MKRLYIALILLPILLLSPLFADERTEPIDVIIALDKSLSMVEEIEAVKEYVNTHVIEDLLIPGDFFLVVAFYGDTIVPVSTTIEGPEDKERAKERIAALLADGRFTDIGNALDVLGEQIERHSRPDREKYLLLITDGIQEAPPQSKYYSPDGSFNHAFLENVKTIQQKGWKVVILGAGTDAQAHELAQDLAQQLSGDYAQLSEEPTAEELIQKTQEFLAVLRAEGGAELGPVDLQGRGTLTMSVSSEGYAEARSVRIRAIQLSIPGEGTQNILPAPVQWDIPPASSGRFSAPVQLSAVPASGEHSGRLEFEFSGTDRFVPVVIPVEFRVLSFVGSYWLWVLIGALVLLALIVLIIVLVGRARKPRYRFRLMAEGQAAEQAQEVYKAVEGKPLYLNEVEGTVTVARNRSPQSIARLVAIPKGVRMGLLKPERFPKLTDVPLNVLDFDFRVRVDLDKRRDVTVRLASVR
ncbi:MAG: VWA domain-containing protein [Spirochaetales bacterium]|nr:VWA domain-containing protein [Spirochaetales bacterium]